MIPMQFKEHNHCPQWPKKTPKRGHNETTSEDEKNKGGTLDSAPIDRAKSFEYFPGESFPLQENSSSYEYLPGNTICSEKLWKN